MVGRTENYKTHYRDYDILRQLKKHDSKRLCELAIIKAKDSLNIEIPNNTLFYDKNEHQKLWTEISRVFDKSQKESDFIRYFYDFMTQFSPDGNVYSEENVNHIKHYVKTAAEILESFGVDKKRNIIEFGSNSGILSFALQVFGQTVLCTDLHHGIVSNSINSYKAGTWVRENFIGINACDTFKFKEDDINNLQVFDDGIDAIIMRGTGILSIGCINIKRSLLSRALNKIKRIVFKNSCEAKQEMERRITNVEKNIEILLKIINREGIIFAKNENIFSGIKIERRIEMAERLKDRLSNKCDLKYKIEAEKYINPGWEEFIMTITCKKK